MRRVTSIARDMMLPLAARRLHRAFGPVDDTILIVQPDHLGDVILSQPAVHLLRERHPESRLVAVVGPWSREVVDIAWPVDEIVTVEFPGFTRDASGSLLGPYRQLRMEARAVAPFRAKAAYVLRPDAWWAAWLAALVAPEVVTSADSRARRFATHIVSVADDEHATARALRIAARNDLSGVPTPESFPLSIPEFRDRTALGLLLPRHLGVLNRYIVIHPGSGATVKEWPVHRWRTVAGALSRLGYAVVLTGSPAEAALCNAIAEGRPEWRSLAGRTNVAQLAEALRGASLVLGPDCGPLHLAVAVGTPTLHIFGPSDPGRFGPWGNSRRHRVVSAGWSCPRCGDLSLDRPASSGCMLAVPPIEVISTAQAMLSSHAM